MFRPLSPRFTVYAGSVQGVPKGLKALLVSRVQQQDSPTP